jgi:hypothetical protein
MGSFIEVNDTLQITPEQGFPIDILDLKKHQQEPITLEDLAGKVLSFHNKPRPRLYHLEPVRVFLVQNIGGKWLFWGKIQIQSQKITKKFDSDGNWIKGEWETSGTYIFSEVYEPDYQRVFTIRESIPGRSYF